MCTLILPEFTLSCVQLFAIPWTIACQALLSMDFSRQEYCSGLSFPSPEYLPNSWIKATSPAAPALAGGFFYHWASWETPDHPQIMLLPPDVMDFIGYSWLYTPHILNSNLQTLLLHKWTHGTSFLSICFPIIMNYSVQISNVKISENKTYRVQHYRTSFFLIITFP